MITPGGQNSGPPGDIQGWLYVMIGELHAGVQFLTSGHHKVMGRLDAGHDRMNQMDAETREIKAKLAAMSQPTSSATSKPPERVGVIRAIADLATATSALAKAVAPIREWVTGAGVVASSLYAILQPEQVRVWLIALLGTVP